MVSVMRYQTKKCGTSQEIEHEQLISAPPSNHTVSDGGPKDVSHRSLVDPKGNTPLHGKPKGFTYLLLEPSLAILAS